MFPSIPEVKGQLVFSLGHGQTAEEDGQVSTGFTAALLHHYCYTQINMKCSVKELNLKQTSLM